ncbi:hypothetical protein TNCT_617261 [Trichonephila clavata]|uniref:Uncharacterized protein n=1 Tax=Trichonephila clavata TaxID=2740835 RepID=A0A8X6KAF9_TRICU|nr:hypothetical protein TNCT_617261 [Trichonephila clavata]
MRNKLEVTTLSGRTIFVCEKQNRVEYLLLVSIRLLEKNDKDSVTTQCVCCKTAPTLQSDVQLQWIGRLPSSDRLES